MTHQPPHRPDRPGRGSSRADRADFGRAGRTDRPDYADRADRAGRAGRDDRFDDGYPDDHSGVHSGADTRPLPQEIYTRRRVAAVAVILAVVALVVWGLTAFARSGGDDDAPETPTAAPSTLVTTPTEPNPEGADAASGETDATAAEATGTDAKSSDAKSSDSAATEEGEPGKDKGNDKDGDGKPDDGEKPDAEALAAKKTCELEDLQLTAELNKTAFGQGEPAEERKFSVLIHNPTGGDCVIDTDDNQLRFAAFSIAREGYQQIWSDTDCNKPMITGKETFAAGETRKFTATWSGLDSAPERCDARQPAAPGAYAAVGFLGENSSAPVTFNITG